MDPILVAEDNLINQKVIEAMIRRLGYPVRMAENGRQALEAFSRGRVVMIFMDCQMPEMDGFEACGEIRKREKDAHIPIVAVTANAMKGDRERCLAAGMDDYISKPFRQDEIRRMIERWLGGTVRAG